MKKYVVLNPADGQYQEFNSPEEAGTVALHLAMQLFLAHTHGTPFSVVERNEHGNEVWTVPGEEENPMNTVNSFLASAV